MSDQKRDYILGTDRNELRRLGFQHEVWSREFADVLDRLEIQPNHRILDLGSGPGFCAIPMALRTVEGLGVTAIDKSSHFLESLGQQGANLNLSITTEQMDIDSLKLSEECYDIIWGRWVLAWLKNVEIIFPTLVKSLKSGGRMAFHEYYDWKTFQTEPLTENLSNLKSGILKSFEGGGGDINIGRKIPKLMEQHGLEVESIQPLAKLGRPHSPTWMWVKTFFQVYGPKVVEGGHISIDTLHGAIKDLEEIEKRPGASLLGPLVIEVIGKKVN